MLKQMIPFYETSLCAIRKEKWFSLLWLAGPPVSSFGTKMFLKTSIINRVIHDF